MKGQINIERMFAFIARDPGDGTEGVVGVLNSEGAMVPMVGADMDRIASLEPLAQGVANAMKTSIQLVCFTNREEIKLIEPNRQSTSQLVPLGDPDSSFFGVTKDDNA